MGWNNVLHFEDGITEDFAKFLDLGKVIEDRLELFKPFKVTHIVVVDFKSTLDIALSLTLALAEVSIEVVLYFHR